MSTIPKQQLDAFAGHSTDVKLLLHIDGTVVPLTHTASDRIRLEQDTHVPNGPARVEVIMDGISHFTNVTILGPAERPLWVNIA